MTRSDEIHAANMAVYHVDRLAYEQSPYRKACGEISLCAVCSGAVGCVCASPIVFGLMGESTALTISTLSSVLCCIGGGIAAGIADEPEPPEHPDQVVRQSPMDG